MLLSRGLPHEMHDGRPRVRGAADAYVLSGCAVPRSLQEESRHVS